MFWACALLLVAGASASTLKDANLTALAKASERDEKRELSSFKGTVSRER